MKAAPLIFLGLAALAAALSATPAQAQSANAYEDRAWETSKDLEVLLDAMRRRMALDRLMEPPGESALDILRALRDQKASRPEVEELTRDLFVKMLQKGQAAMQARAYERSSQWLRAAREVAANPNDPALEQAESELSTARKQYPALGIIH